MFDRWSLAHTGVRQFILFLEKCFSLVEKFEIASAKEDAKGRTEAYEQGVLSFMLENVDTFRFKDIK